ncbi:uncharacterized protein A1O9_00698 [Exophiala aquamarina CBS 119918]|uniref:Uncharacterized protein n=1 Tax=Exophiala aquamarina CBS 119918 TaxID=1182545 RepID=A0A072Q494_9EURO|nr:uncharacterized protein A1O9_00698 [Exophiala aquamarina CBS 119918]KEF62725.1 hypothetical protein A1O9_00698 [Exophiala aquamarina CBS 119918]
MAPVKIGLIGLSATGGSTGGGSWASRSHVPYFLQSPHYEITAVQNSTKTSAEKSIKDYNIPGKVAAYGDPETLAADANVNMAVVSVKVPLHAKLIKPQLEAKKDIFVEWPLAANLQEAEELTALAKANGAKTLVGLQARQDPSVRRAREIVQSGELGDILGTTMLGAGAIWQGSVGTDFEYSLPLENGANMVTIPAGHAMDALCYVLGEFKDLQATLANSQPSVPVTDAAGKVLRTADKTSHDWMSVSGTLVGGGVATTVYHAGSSPRGANFYWEINGTKGTLVLEGPVGHVQMFHPTLKILRAGEKAAKLEDVQVDASPKPDFSFNVGKAWDAFLGHGDGHVTSFEDALVRHRMIDAIYRSNESGKRESYL